MIEESLAQPKSKKKRSVKSYASTVFKESSVSAVSGIISTASVPRKVFRGVIFLIFTVGFLYQCIKFLLFLLEYPTVVDIEITKPEEYMAPAYTFCNNQKVKRSEYCNKYPDRCISTDEPFCKDNAPYCKQAENKVKDEYLMDEVTFEDILQLGFQHNETLMLNSADWDVQNKTLLRMRNTDDYSEFSGCFSINAIVNSAAEPYILKRQERLPLRFEDDFRFIFDPGENDIFDPYVLPGVRLAIHSPFDAVNPFLVGHFLKPGREYKITIYMQEEKLLPYPYKTDCKNYHQSWIESGRSGPRSQEMCREKCYVDIVSRCFNCSSYFFLFPSDKENICDFTQNKTKLPQNCDPTMMTETMHECIASCKDECMKIKYYSEVRELYFSRKAPNSSEFKNPRLIYVLVDIDDREVMKYVFRPQYQNVEAFSYIGGFIGIWLGISLVQVTDFFESLFLIARYFCKKRTRKFAEEA